MSILGRKVFYSIVNGKIVFADMSIVKTQIGEMVEPLNLAVSTNDGLAMEMADEVAMITEMEFVDNGKVWGMLPFVEDGIIIHAFNTPKNW